METLYRKYRPQKFGELTGQNHIRMVLEGELASGRLAHAYLFSGPRGVGKTTVARILAKALNCLNRSQIPDPRSQKQSEPCNKCEACLEITQARAMDVIEIDAASHTGVDHVREHIIENARFAPTRWQYKVFIIDEVHMLSTSAFNALLKTLEEPPAHAIFIMATTELHKVPETIASRCQQFDFRRVGREELVLRLKRMAQSEKVRVHPKVLETIARVAEGCPRDAESLLGQIMVLDDKGEITEEQASLVLPQSYRALVRQFITLLIKGDAKTSVAFVGKLVDQGVGLTAFVKETILVLREILLSKLEHGEEVLPSDFEAEEKDVVAGLEVRALPEMIERINRSRLELDRADIVQLPLELAAVELCLVGEGVKEKEPLPVSL